MTSHVGQRISKYDVAQLFGTAYVNSATMRNAIAGFSCTGLWPFNPDVFNDDDFSASMITEEDPNSGQVSTSSTTTLTTSAAERPAASKGSMRSVQPTTPSSSAAVQSTVQSSSEPSRKKKSSEEQKAMEAVKTYFLQKTANSTSTAPDAHSSVADMDNEERFDRMIAAEMHHIKTPALKREVKRKMWELVMTAQEDEEQLKMQNA